MRARARARQVFDIGAYVLVAAVVLQFFLAGLGVFADARLFFWHTTVNAIVIFFGSIILVLLGWYAGLDRRTVGMPGIIAGLVILQSLVIFGVAIGLVDRIRHARSPLPEAETARERGA